MNALVERYVEFASRPFADDVRPGLKEDMEEAIASGSTLRTELLGLTRESLRLSGSGVSFRESVARSFDWTIALGFGAALGIGRDARWVAVVLGVLMWLGLRFNLRYTLTLLGIAAGIVSFITLMARDFKSFSFVLVLPLVCVLWKGARQQQAKLWSLSGTLVGLALTSLPETGSVYAIAVLAALLIATLNPHPFILLTAVPWFVVIGPSAVVGLTRRHGVGVELAGMLLIAMLSILIARRGFRKRSLI